MLGIGRAASYEAARRGDIPTLKIGRRIVVPLVGGAAPDWRSAPVTNERSRLR